MKKCNRGIWFVILTFILLALAGCNDDKDTKETEKISQTETIVESEDSKTTSSSKIDTSDPEVVSEFDQYLYDTFVESASSDALNLHFTLKDPSAYGIELSEVSFGRMDPVSLEKDWVSAFKLFADFDVPAAFVLIRHKRPVVFHPVVDNMQVGMFRVVVVFHDYIIT